MSTSRRPVPTRGHPGFPKFLPCLRCGLMRRATWAGDRLHAKCGQLDGVLYEARGTVGRPGMA